MTNDGVLHSRYAMNSEDYNQNDRKIVVTTATINGGNFTILVLPNLGGISGQLTKTTRGNHTAGQTVRLPHPEER
jgi:Flp pilus assembly secretin CpaC